MRFSLLQIDMLQTLQPFLLNLSIYALNSMLLFVSSHVRRYFSGVHSVHPGSHILFFVFFFWLAGGASWLGCCFFSAGWNLCLAGKSLSLAGCIFFLAGWSLCLSSWLPTWMAGVSSWLAALSSWRAGVLWLWVKKKTLFVICQ